MFESLFHLAITFFIGLISKDLTLMFGYLTGVILYKVCSNKK